MKRLKAEPNINSHNDSAKSTRRNRKISICWGRLASWLWRIFSVLFFCGIWTNLVFREFSLKLELREHFVCSIVVIDSKALKYQGPFSSNGEGFEIIARLINVQRPTSVEPRGPQATTPAAHKHRAAGRPTDKRDLHSLVEEEEEKALANTWALAIRSRWCTEFTQTQENGKSWKYTHSKKGYKEEKVDPLA